MRDVRKQVSLTVYLVIKRIPYGCRVVIIVITQLGPAHGGELAAEARSRGEH